MTTAADANVKTSGGGADKPYGGTVCTKILAWSM